MTLKTGCLDQNLSDPDANEWNTFKENFTNLKSIGFPRWVKSQDKIPVQIHGFSDASEKVSIITSKS